MPIVGGRDDEGAARAADRQRLARLCLLCPARRRPGIVNGEVDRQRIFDRIIMARREIASQHVGRAFGVGGAVREEQLYVIVEAEAPKTFEIASERDADHVGGDLFDLRDRQGAPPRLVTHALGAARIGRRRGGRLGRRWGGSGHCKKAPTLLYRVVDASTARFIRWWIGIVRCGIRFGAPRLAQRGLLVLLELFFLAARACRARPFGAISSVVRLEWHGRLAG